MDKRINLFFWNFLQQKGRREKREKYEANLKSDKIMLNKRCLCKKEIPAGSQITLAMQGSPIGSPFQTYKSKSFLCIGKLS